MYVDYLDGPRDVGAARNYKLFKVVLNNDVARRSSA